MKKVTENGILMIVNIKEIEVLKWKIIKKSL